MSDVVVNIEQVGKKFCRSWPSSLRYGFADGLRRALGRPRRLASRADEFWAIDGVTAIVRRGECLGVVGPNGAGKSTLLKLIAHEYQPDRGSVSSRGCVESLLRLGTGLQPMLTGRENIYIKCSQMGLAKPDVEARLAAIIDFAELHQAIDMPVRHYSDGMYARLDFAIATSAPVDVLLVDEVLAVGDIAFQRRCLDRLNALKRDGTAVVLVSHAEMNIRYVADRCLFLLGGRSVAVGDPDAVIRKYHEAVGYLNPKLASCGPTTARSEDFEGPAMITALRPGTATAAPGQGIEWTVDYRRVAAEPSPTLVLQFWNSADVLVASIDSTYSGRLQLEPGAGRLRVSLPFLGLAPGTYRVAGGFARGHRFLGYRKALATLQVCDSDYQRYGGLIVMPSAVTPVPPGAD